MINHAEEECYWWLWKLVIIMMMMIMIRMMMATEERKGKVGGLPAEEEQLPPEGDNSGRSSNTYFLSSSRLRQTTQNYKKNVHNRWSRCSKIDKFRQQSGKRNCGNFKNAAHNLKSCESFVSSLTGQPFIFRAVSQWWHISWLYGWHCGWHCLKLELHLCWQSIEYSRCQNSKV